MKRKQCTPPFVICIRNEGHEASLELRKVYEVVADQASEQHHRLRIIDEAGEDYLYPETFFVSIELPKAVEKALVFAP
jgi:hypothetical protein